MCCVALLSVSVAFLDEWVMKPSMARARRPHMRSRVDPRARAPSLLQSAVSQRCRAHAHGAPPDQSAYGCGQAARWRAARLPSATTAEAGAAPTSPRCSHVQLQAKRMLHNPSWHRVAAVVVCAFAVLSCRARRRPFALSPRPQPATAASCSAVNCTTLHCAPSTNALVPLGTADDLEVAGIVLHLDV